MCIRDRETEALDQETNSHTGTVAEKTVINDLVNYSNLISGEEYTIRGKLMVKETGEPLLIDGQEVTAEAEFVPESAAGTVTLTYELDSSALAGETIVVFEDLIYKGITILSHADIEDEAQSVYYPELQTEATAYGKHEVIAKGTVTIEDSVSYSNLIPGKTYTLKGVLMDRETGEKLLVNGTEVTATETFVPQEASGTVKMPFTFQADGLAGKAVVVFEELYHNQVVVGTHADLTDQAQSVFLQAPPQTPKTGDHHNLPLTAGVLAGSVAGVSILFWKLRKRRRIDW